MYSSDHSKYVEITVHFRCNLKCQHCMILDSMHWLKPASQNEFDQLMLENQKETKWTGLIITGSEVTLRKDLPDLARQARESGFQHVRIQTHGMRLANLDYCKMLIDAGIDEYFVSVTADHAELHDRITGVKGSFDRTIQGIQNLDSLGTARVLTNTVITGLSYQSLPGVVDLLAGFENLERMDFWTYWPMSEKDNSDLMVSHLDTAPFLRKAIRMLSDMGKKVEVKNFPQCLLGSEADALINDQPELRIDPRFWDEFNRNGFHQCVYRDVCGSKQCLGLNAAYADRFGWHE
ncbi:MAG: radical SAM protein, partial [Planctomycetaceae bacterium]|nr:radical SAM protein [Planctomycetaceae bacterium]